MADATAVGEGKRADARRNISAILDAGLECLTRDPDANIGDIAKHAGVGRVTLYGHFASRAELVDAVFTRAVAEADEALDAVDLSGEPRAALVELVDRTWHIVDRFRAVLLAAQRTLPAERIHDAHAGPMRRIQGLIERGRARGDFRGDLPVQWLVTVFYSVVHAAADEINAGRLDREEGADVITRTLLAAFAG